MVWLDVDGMPGMCDVEVKNVESLEDGDMMELQVGHKEEERVLITKYKGELHAIRAFCSLCEAPLAHGVLFDDKVLCPHGAGFSITSGALERAPARDGVPYYKVHDMNGKKYVRVPCKMEKR